MLTTTVGNYPKIPLGKNQLHLKRALDLHDREELSDEELERIYRETIIRTIDDQVKAGIDIVTDGQIRWTELTYPPASSLISVHPGGLRRFFDNNFYYRRPQITDLISRNKELVTEEYRFASEHSQRPVKAVICGPITFCALSDNYYYKSFAAVAEAYADILAEEVSSLVEAGCRYIQLDEPSLPDYPGRMELAAACYEKIFSGVDIEYGIFIYFRPIKQVAEAVFDLPLKFLGLDLVSNPDDVECLQDFPSDKKLVAGVFDGRNIMLENEKTVRRRIQSIIDSVDQKRVILSPSCGLEFLPPKYALAKLKRLSEVARKMEGAQ